jgi:predicted enzyme related to lactoylglutathione lyase
MVSRGRREETLMLSESKMYATIPAQDLERAKSFYADRLELKPAEERPEGLLYESGGAQFLLFPSSGQASGTHTQLSWDVEDLDKTVAKLRENGVKFEEYDLPGFKTVDGIAEIAGERGAWFKDSEGNLLAIGEQMGS